MKEQKKRSHRLTETKPVLAMFLLALVVLLCMAVCSILGSMVIRMIWPDADPVLFGSIGSILGPIAALVILKLWYAPEFKGSLASGLSGKQTLLFTLPIIIYSLLVLIVQLIEYHFHFNPTLNFLLMALSAGFTEEVMFRTTVIPIGMGFLKGDKKIWVLPIVTSLIFGISHLSNIFAGASVVNGIHQTISSMLIGLYFGVLYLCTGSVAPGIIMHAIYDFICFAGDPSLTNGVMTGTVALWEQIFSFASSAALAAAGVAMIRTLGKEKILDVWRKKWSQK